jgi:hypothetical protein
MGVSTPIIMSERIQFSKGNHSGNSEALGGGRISPEMRHEKNPKDSSNPESREGGIISHGQMFSPEQRKPKKIAIDYL